MSSCAFLLKIQAAWISNWNSREVAMNRKVLRCLIGSILAIALVVLGWPQPTMAIVRQQEEAPGQILYQARHTLRDSSGNSWQVVLFKRVKDERVQGVNLRLVGFPGGVAFVHPQALTVVAGERRFQGADQFAQSSPAPNVGQYDVKEILGQLPQNRSAFLQLPLEGDRSPRLEIPPPVILEWQYVGAS